MQRFSQQFLPSSFNDVWIRNSIGKISDNEIQLRNFAQLQNYHSNLVKLDVFPLYSFPKIWEEFVDENIKIVRKKADFDNKLKDYFLNDLAAVASCNRLLCPACKAGRNWKCDCPDPVVSCLFLLLLLFVVPGVRLTLPCPSLSPPLILSLFYSN